MMLYIVRHSFKNKGTKYLPGDIIKSPEDIKLFKCKLTEGSVLAFRRQEPSTIDSLKFLSEKLGLPILENVKSYLAEVDKLVAKVETEEPEKVETEETEEQEIIEE